MVENRNLTDHFTLFEMTHTSLERFQEKNRELTEDQIDTLTNLARLLEHIRWVLSTPLIISSAYRCQELNQAVGSTGRSQHLLCEAADFVPINLDLGIAFREIWNDIKDNGANVGQLIYETDARPYGVTSWLHVSLGTPYRPREKCGEILRMENGKYERLS